MHFSDQPSDYSAPKIFLHNINSNEGALLKKAFELGWPSILSNPQNLWALTFIWDDVLIKTNLCLFETAICEWQKAEHLVAGPAPQPPPLAAEQTSLSRGPSLKSSGYWNQSKISCFEKLGCLKIFADLFWKCLFLATKNYKSRTILSDANEDKWKKGTDFVQLFFSSCFTLKMYISCICIIPPTDIVICKGLLRIVWFCI